MFLHFRNCDLLADDVAHFDRSSGWPPWGEQTTVFAFCRFMLS